MAVIPVDDSTPLGVLDPNPGVCTGVTLIRGSTKQSPLLLSLADGVQPEPRHPLLGRSNFFAVSQANEVRTGPSFSVPYTSLILTSKIPTMSVEITTA